MKIGISGIVGVGKSTLSELLSKELGYQLIREPINEKELEHFYTGKNNEKQNQMSFLLNTITQEMSYGNENVIYDRTLAEHIHYFARLNLKESDYISYNIIQERIINFAELKNYDIIIHLNCDFDTMIERINKRGRDSEKNTSIEYWQRLYQVYQDIDILKNYTSNLVVIDTSYMSSQDVLEEVMRRTNVF